MTLGLFDDEALAPVRHCPPIVWKDMYTRDGADNQYCKISDCGSYKIAAVKSVALGTLGWTFEPWGRVNGNRDWLARPQPTSEQARAICDAHKHKEWK